MFEYLMPMLVMRSYPHTVLAQTYDGALARQISYGNERGVPWGVSESAYNVRDRHLTYQYRPFGVPDLALKRGLGRELVIAPYATVLAAMVDPAKALANLRVLEGEGTLGRYGFRDALDYTRPDPDQPNAVVGTFMAHHLGMGLVALTNVLTSEIWQRRFHADAVVRSAELLLHERIPRRLVLQEPQGARPDEALPEAEVDRPAVREVDTPDTPQPHVSLLGHLPYTIMVSHCGAGIQPLRVARGHPLAVGRDPRLDRAVLLREGPGDRPGVVHGAPAGMRAGRLVQRADGHRPDHLPSRRRRDRDPHRDRGGAGGFGRGAPSHPHQQQRRDPGDRAHQLRRDRAGAARGRPAPSRLRQSLRGDRVARLVYRDHRHPAAPLLQGTAALVRARGGHRQASGGAGDLRDRSGPLPRAGPLHPRSHGAGGGGDALGDDRLGARSDLCHSHPAPAGSRPVCIGGVHHLRRHQPGPRLRAGRPLPGFPRGAAGAGPGVDLESGGAARVPSHPQRCGRVSGAGGTSALWQRGAASDRRPSSGGTGGRSRSSGGTASPATGRFCWRPSTRPMACRPCVRSSRPIATGGGEA